jgi:hypothetical protein
MFLKLYNQRMVSLQSDRAELIKAVGANGQRVLVDLAKLAYALNPQVGPKTKLL